MLKQILFDILGPPWHMWLRWKAKSAVTRLISHTNPKLRAIGEALRDSLNHVQTAEEQQWIQRIEQRRAFLLSSEKEIGVVSYGAGRPGSRKTRDEMDRGLHTKALVKNICRASKPPFWANLLFQLVRKLKPSSCVEMGSCVGISAAYLTAACRINSNGELRTLEGSPETAQIAQETLETLGLTNGTVIVGPFHTTLAGVLESAQPIDFFFNDGHHDHDAVIRYLNESVPYLAEEAVMVFDDIAWSPGMRKAWREIEEDDRVVASIDLQDIGIVVFRSQPGPKEKFRIPL